MSVKEHSKGTSLTMRWKARRHLLSLLLVTGFLCACFLVYASDRKMAKDTVRGDPKCPSHQVGCSGESDREKEDETQVLLDYSKRNVGINKTGVCPEWQELREQVLSKTQKFYDSSKRYSEFCIPKLRKTFCSGLLDNVTMFTRKCHTDKEMRFLTDAEAAKRGRFYLASFPGSGNTWSRLLLEETTGVYTGAVYCDTQLLRSGHFGEGINSTHVIAIKSHTRFNTEGLRGIIYIVRNPFHAILSKFAWKSTKAHTTAVQFGDLKDDMVQSFTKSWLGNVQAWVSRRGSLHPTLVVSYDQMVANIEPELHKIADFLNYPVREDRIQCVVSHSMDAHRRNRNRTVNPYTEKQQQIIQNAILSLRDIWEKHDINYQGWRWQA